jgi:hypothetical protein
MSRLTPKAEKLVRAGRAALRPSDADRARIFQALLPQVGGNPGIDGGNAPAAPPAAATPILVKTVTVLVGLVVVGGGLFFALRPAPPSAKTAVAPPTPPVAAPVPVDDARQGPEFLVPQPPFVKKPTVGSRASDSLAQEVAILSRASADLHAGRPVAALAALAEHQRRFPTGVLALERSAARVQALCALGRTKEARVELARLSRTAPSSPHEARARKACGSALTQGE